MGIRTDLAMEAHAWCLDDAGAATQLPGVRARETTRRGITTTVVEVLNGEGAKLLDKPVGTYVTLSFDRDFLRQPRQFTAASLQLGRAVARMTPRSGPVLVAGLGNRALAPDALGPKALESLVVTRHLGRSLPQLRPVSALAPGVLGTTGMESGEVLRGVVARVRPCCVVAVDALAARCPERICTTVQLADSGISPGSGVGNHRLALSRETLGVPVLAVGVPTVVEAATLLQDALGSSQSPTPLCDPSMVVSPKDIDARVGRMARLVGFGLSLGLHSSLTMEDISCLVG